MIYIPLSIQQPSQVTLQRAKQILCAENQSWWPCHDTLLDKVTEPPILLGPCGTAEQSTVDVQQEISAAIDTPLPTSVLRTPSPPQPTFLSRIKTSESHPIK